MNSSSLHHAIKQQWDATPPLDAVIPRYLDISNELETPEVLVITGVRRSGKSSYLRQLQSTMQSTYDVLLVEFDDPNLDGFSGADFEALINFWQLRIGQSEKKRLFLFDEIQMVENWERWIPALAKRLDTKVIVTGSNAQMLSSELGTLLTGRHIAYELTPLSFREIAAYRKGPQEATKTDLLSIYEEYYRVGGFPRAVLYRNASVLPRYLIDIVERDIVARRGARLTRPLKELTRYLCSNNCRLLNRKKIAADLGIKDDTTVKRYCDWLEQSYLFFQVKEFSPSVKKQIRSNPKYYCIDPTLARTSAFSLFGGEGVFLENAVYLELRRRGYELHYYQSVVGKCEVDFIARKAGEDPIAVQVCLLTQDEGTLQRELRGLEVCAEELKLNRLMIITKSDEPQVFTLGGVVVESVPFISWALTE